MTYSIEQRDADVRGTTANIEYHVRFERSSQHLVQVTMQVKAIKSDVLNLVMPSWTPGSYKIRDYIAHQGNVEARRFVNGHYEDAPFTWTDKATLRVECSGADHIEVSYVVYGFDRSVRTNHFTRNHAFIVPAATFMYVEGRTAEVHHIILHHNQSQWPQCSTQLSPVDATGSTGLCLGALNYDILADSPIEIGSHETRSFTAHGATHEVAVAASQPVDVDWLTDRIKKIVDVEAAIFGGVPYDRYVFIVQVYPGAGGGLEHARSSVNAVEPSAFTDKAKASRLLSLLCHEYFHTWNVKRIRPVELGPFDYTREVYTPMLWLAEGLTSYYDDLVHYRCGFATRKEFLDTLASEHLGKLLRTPGRYRMSVRDSSRLAWVKLYQASADGSNRFPSYYLKGGVIMLMLDLYVIAHSDGRASLDDALRALWKRYMERPQTGLTEEECIALMERATGVQFRDRLMAWLNGTEDLDVEDIVKPFGLVVEVSPRQNQQSSFGESVPFATIAPDRSAGWTLSEKNGVVVIKSVEDESPAANAGMGIDDEIIAINGYRVTSVGMVQQLLALLGDNTVEVVAQSDGRLYQTTLTTPTETKVTIRFAEDLSSQQQHLSSVWLRQ